MTTMFGKFCRFLRIEHDEVLRDMAEKLGVSSSYLSAVENGKRVIPPSWRDKIIGLYSLTSDEVDELDEVIYKSQQEMKISINLNRFSDTDRDELMAFARRYDKLDENTKTSLKELFGKKGD